VCTGERSTAVATRTVGRVGTGSYGVGALSVPAIETVGLTKLYGSTRGIEDLELRVEQGEIFGYLGPNGAGKTTTIRVLVDLIRPTRGRAAIVGLDSHSQCLEVRRVTSYLPGELKLPPRSTALAFISYLGRLRGGVDRKVVDELAERLELDLHRKIGDLSKGNKQKVGLVAAFAPDPELLILDEPTSGLDPLRQQDVLQLIRERAAAGRTVFLSSHELDQVEHVAERVGIVRDGRLVAVEAISALKRRSVRRVEVRLADAAPDAERLRDVPGVRDVAVADGVAHLTVEGSMDALVKELAKLPVQSLTSEPPELDEIFLTYYGQSHAD
jgi:ABC-2 type transport system ATP-binding protein